MVIKYLEWDSSFFNKKIGLLDLFQDSKYLEVENDYDLIYVTSQEEIAVNLKNHKQNHSETKVVFSKILVKEKKLADNTTVSGLNNARKEAIYELAFESGKFSRFNLDFNFTNSEFKQLYKQWVDNSYSREFADDILVYEHLNESIGFVTYKIFENSATIGLLAVSPLHQGKGIGKKLLEAVESKLVALKVNELRIPTQLQNKRACKFYAQLGYTIIEKIIIKHYWKK
jgi:dTDP-4-amino-4,6-dideoxy-D-galactose acyltransferase